MALALVIADQPARIGLHRFSPTLWYFLASAGLFGVWVGFYIWSPFGFDQPGRDSWHHAAVLRELMVEPFAPSNPHLPTDEPSRYFTPIALLAALFGKLFGLSPYALFGLMGAASCLGLVAGCWLFARRYYGSPWAPLILLLTLLFAWGAQMGHAGFHNYATLLSSAAYPSTIALVLGLFSWALALRVLDSDQGRAGQLILLGALSATTLLVHQLSGVIVLAGTASLVMFHDRASMRAKAAPFIALTLGGLSTLAWPYFSILEVISSASDPRWTSAVGEMNRPSTLLLLAAPTFVGVIGFRKPDGGLRWEILVPAALFSAAYLVLTVQGSAIAHRIPPAIILFNQLGIVWLVLGLTGKADDAPRLKAVLAATTLILIAFTALIAGTTRLQDLERRASDGSMVAMAEAIADSMPPGAISFATEGIVFPLQSTGRRVVSIPRPEPAAHSLALRQLATDRLFQIDTGSEERLRLIDRWKATHVVWVPSNVRPEVAAELKTLGPLSTFSHGAHVVTIEQKGAVAQLAKGTKDDR